MSEGKLIVMEGLDGCGKSTQARLLGAHLLALGRDCSVQCEPTAGEIGRLIRRVLSGEVAASPQVQAALFVADRIAHNDEITELLSAGKDVISDRYYYSSLAYQGSYADEEWVKQINTACPYIRRPDLCIFLEAPVEVCLSRIAAGRNASEREIFENAESLERIRARFDEVFASLPEDPVVRIDASGSPEEIRARINAEADRVLGLNN
ncbi:MAG: dTMP kinase [Clostridia bacterium]|nr:dTMP kinase [Clostridia bacterium]